MNIEPLIYHFIFSGVAPPKTGLQWQQPFLELVLACMNAQTTTHEELLGPLRVQLQGFLAAFDKVCSCQTSDDYHAFVWERFYLNRSRS